ncbi:multifunctional 2',3'-cyclic-nucleotide 2'-phosphodiesterase/5'-nucleotidase/3'-nucleotidase [bacterium]|nr:MAG: multifunctional 2',3'-cyclic-nucleotide 2'-phosphodiesterase/5'-nucleotidase/3'-nucleotidase [bacterium]
MRRALSAGLLLLSAFAAAEKPITITFLHCNDTHAHIEPTIIKGKSYGGFARQFSLIERLRKSEPNVVLLHAGDVFQGTLFFNVYEGLADLSYLNLAGFQAQTLGNHEFDNGPAGLAQYAKGAAFPLLAANIDVSGEPLLKDRIKPFAILNVDGERVGVVGSLTPDTPNISSPGPTVKFIPNVPAIQGAVDTLTAQGVDKIVLLSHNGYSEDRAIAKAVKGLDLVIGGHSHTPLGTPAIEGWPTAQGPFPTFVDDPDGRRVPIVQAWEWGKVLGRTTISFDAKGETTKVDAQPIVLDETIPEDPLILRLVANYNRPIAALKDSAVGSVAEAVGRNPNQQGENLMGNLIADAILEKGALSGAEIGFCNRGGLRAELDKGEVTYGEAIAVQPFGNTLVIVELTGAEILQGLNDGLAKGGMLYPSKGFSYTISGDKAIEASLDGKPLEPRRIYKVAFQSFIANGGDFHETIKNAKGKRLDTGFLDIDVLVSHLKTHNPYAPRYEGRVRRR